MNTQNRADATPVQIRADHASEKRLGNWTAARAFQVRARLTGQVRHGEIRVHSGGTAQLSVIASREYLTDARRPHAEGSTPTLDDPARSV